jgi:UDP-N-acetylglucosamine--N-acetylmuramyl-(pentapeptide) pyrophosphoryl-undecaprenol N-acetylglucosamine transferase
MAKILLTGGGSGGHFYPLLAVIEKLKEMVQENVELIYFGPNDQYSQELEKIGIKIVHIIPSKMRRYFSLANILEIPKFLIGLIEALIKIYFIMPDVIFSKGGPGSLPVLLAGRFYLIPIIIHESDAVPSFTTSLTERFAKKIEISFEETRNYLRKKQNTSLTGNPIREEMIKNKIKKEDAKELLDFKENLPVLVILGGSLGAQRLNQFVFDNFENLLNHFQVFHQVGKNNLEEAKVIVESFKKEMSSYITSRYKMEGFLDSKEMALILSAADIVLSRAGAGAIFEIAFFGKPSFLVPLPQAAQNHQKVNAYAYAQGGAAIVLEEENLKFSTFILKVQEILNNPQKYEEMSNAALKFSKQDSALIIAKDILSFIKV